MRPAPRAHGTLTAKYALKLKRTILKCAVPIESRHRVTEYLIAKITATL